jgi:hypothetical protein
MKTAVECLMEKINLKGLQTDKILEIVDLFNKAKEMEKQQIISVIKLVIEKEYHEQNWCKCGAINYVAENYYNEAFKNTENEDR